MFNSELIKVDDLQFTQMISYEDINTRIKTLAHKINEDYENHYHKSNLVVIGILNGCYMFLSELTKNITVPCIISFMRVSSYEKTNSTGKINMIMDLQEDIEDKDVIIIEDIVDTGFTITKLINHLYTKNPSSVKLASLFNKTDKNNVKVNYCGFDIGNKFIVGFGLDYNGYGRNLKDVYEIYE